MHVYRRYNSCQQLYPPSAIAFHITWTPAHGMMGSGLFCFVLFFLLCAYCVPVFPLLFLVFAYCVAVFILQCMFFISLADSDDGAHHTTTHHTSEYPIHQNTPHLRIPHNTTQYPTHQHKPHNSQHKTHQNTGPEWCVLHERAPHVPRHHTPNHVTQQSAQHNTQFTWIACCMPQHACWPSLGGRAAPWRGP